MSHLFSLDRFDHPGYLQLIVVAVLFWWLARRSLAGLGPIRGKLALGLRVLVLALLLLTLAGTHRILENDDLSVLFLIDHSRSITPELKAQTEEFIAKAGGGMKPNDRLGILTFDGGAYIEQLPSRAGPDGPIHIATPLADGQQPDRTNISQGLRVAAACALDSTNNRVVLLSDGIQNLGDALEEAKAARANGMRIDVVPLRQEVGAEVVFEQLVVPPYSNLHEQVPLRLVLRSDRPATGNILVYQRVGNQEILLDLSPDKEGAGQRVTLSSGRNAFNVRVPIREARAHEFRGEFVPDNPSTDQLKQNNLARGFTNVEGPKTVLFIGAPQDTADDEALVDALKKEGIRVQKETAITAEIDTATLQDFSAIILSNVGADIFSAAQHQALASYVRDLGGGLLMLGGDDSFAAGGWQGSVVEEIMPVKFDVDALKQIPRGALAIVMHSCEMPQGNMWGVETAVAALKTLSRLDYFGVVGWGMSGFRWEVPMSVASNKESIVAQLRKMQNADMFDFDTPMRMAYKALMACRDAAQRHMIIISDGDPAPPSSGLLNQMVGNRITCSTVSIFPHGGQEIATMKNIAKVTGGRYWSLNNPGDEKQLPRIFIKEAKIVRRPVIRDEPFKPKVKPHLSEIMTGIETDLPQLGGYVVTTPRKVPDVEMPLVTQRGDPLLAHWLCGFGRTLAFTSGRWKHWGTEWVGWPGFSKLWAQAVRWCMQQGSSANYDVRTTVDGDEAHVVIESMADASAVSAPPQFAGRAIAPDGTATPVSIMQTGPGRYEGKFKVDSQGTFLLNVVAATPGEKPTMIRTGVTLAYSPEFRDLQTNEALLHDIAQASDGRVLSTTVDPKTVFAHNLPPTISRQPIWDTLLKLAVFMFLLDVALRRIAIEPRKVWATTRTYIASLPGRLGVGQKAAKTLGDLKGVRAKVKADRTAEGDVGPRMPGPGAMRPSTGTKFEAEPGTKAATEDLTKALGGPGAAPPKPATAKDEPKQPTESTTARLLKAKKRAKDDQQG